MDNPDRQRLDGPSGASDRGVRSAQHGLGGSVVARVRRRMPWLGTIGPVLTLADAVAVVVAGSGGDRRLASDPGRRRRCRRAGRPGRGPAPATAGALDRRGPVRAVRRRGRCDRGPGRRRVGRGGVLRARPRLPGAVPHPGLRRHPGVASWRTAREAGRDHRHRGDRPQARAGPALPTRARSPPRRLRRHRTGQRPRPGPRPATRPPRAGRRTASVDDRDPGRRGGGRAGRPGRRRGDRRRRGAARHARRRLRRARVVAAGASALPTPARAGRRDPRRAPPPSRRVVPGAGVQAAGRDPRRPGLTAGPAPRPRGACSPGPGRDGWCAGRPAADRRARPGGDGSAVPHPAGPVSGSPRDDVLGRHLGSDRAGRTAAAPHPTRRAARAGVGAAAQGPVRRRRARRHNGRPYRPRREPTSRR